MLLIGSGIFPIALGQLYDWSSHECLTFCRLTQVAAGDAVLDFQ